MAGGLVLKKKGSSHNNQATTVITGTIRDNRTASGYTVKRPADGWTWAGRF
jgi:hypothetical protein